ncbi:MAG TPA: hypothetical protein V6D18_13450 [Thermosynechococcaceae cyanobacterium]
MKPELEDLRISEAELERLSGLDVGEVFVGSVFGGVCRPSIVRSSRRLSLFLLTEVLVTALTFVFTIPIGLFVTNNRGTVNDWVTIAQFLQITLGITLGVVVAWNLHMKVTAKRFRTFMGLLDEVDGHNEVIQAVDLLDRVGAVKHCQVSLVDREQVLSALALTRENLVCALMTEKILREGRGLLSRRQDLVAHIEGNLTTLRGLELNQQASEYGQLLNEAVQIGISVRREVERLS